MTRRSRRNRVLVLAVGVSLLFHLSTVTVFRIVINFPADDIDYYRMQIIDTRETAWLDRELIGELHVPSPDAALERLEDQGPPIDVERWASLPPIQLPTLEFAELDRLRIRREGVRVQSRYEALLGDASDDTWSRFGRRLSSLGDALSRLRPGGTADAIPAPRPAGRPAPGFAAYVEWMTEPKDREVLSIGKIEALWGMDAAQLAAPVALVFKVNRDGKVVQIIETADGDKRIVEDAVRALMGYQFEPVGEDAPSFQHGTLVIRAEGEN